MARRCATSYVNQEGKAVALHLKEDLEAQPTKLSLSSDELIIYRNATRGIKQNRKQDVRLTIWCCKW